MTSAAKAVAVALTAAPDRPARRPRLLRVRIGVIFLFFLRSRSSLRSRIKYFFTRVVMFSQTQTDYAN